MASMQVRRRWRRAETRKKKRRKTLAFWIRLMTAHRVPDLSGVAPYTADDYVAKLWYASNHLLALQPKGKV